MTKLIIAIPDAELANFTQIIKNKGDRIVVNPNQIETDGSYWNALSDKQKRKVLLAYEESENDENLVDVKAISANKTMPNVL